MYYYLIFFFYKENLKRLEKTGKITKFHVDFGLLDPDPADRNQCGSESGSETLEKSQINSTNVAVR